MTLSAETYPMPHPEANPHSQLFHNVDSTSGEVEEVVAQLSGFLGSLKGNPYAREYLLELAERFRDDSFVSNIPTPSKTNTLTPNQTEISEHLLGLKETLPQYRQGLNSNASSAVFLGHINRLSSLAQVYLRDINEAEPTEVQDETISTWKNDIENLENTVLTNLLSEMSTCIGDLEHDRKLLKDHQDDIERKVEEIKNVLGDKLKQIEEVRMKQAFFDDAVQFQILLKRATESMFETKKSFGIMKGDDRRQDEENFDRIKSAFHTLQDSLLSYETRLEAVHDHEESLLSKLPQVSDEVSVYMNNVETSWKAFVRFCHDQEESVKSVEHWLNLHTHLEEISEHLHQAEGNMKTASSLSLTDLPQATREIEDLLSQSSMLLEQSMATNLMEVESPEDITNKEAFINRQSALSDQLSTLRNNYDTSKAENIQHAFDQDVESIRQKCAKEKDIVQLRRKALGEQFLPDGELSLLKSIIKNDQEPLSSSADVLGQLQQEWSGVQEVMQELVGSRDDNSSIDVDTDLESLDSAIGAENQQLHVYENIVTHIQAARSIEDITNEFIADILEIRITVDQNFLDLIEQKATDIEKRTSVIDEFNSLTTNTLQSFQTGDPENTLGSDTASTFAEVVTTLNDKTKQEWSAMITFLNNKRHIMTEYKDALISLDKAKAKLNKMGNSEEIGRIVDPEQELATIEADIQDKITPAVNAVSQMLVDFADIDQSMEASRHSLDKKLQELNQLVQSKRGEVGKAHEFHALADEVDKLMGRMLEIYDATQDETFSYEAALHHLESNFIALAPDIVKTIEKAHAIAMELDDWRVIARWNVLPEQWEELRSLLSKRKKELLEAYKKASVSTRRRASQSTSSGSTTPLSRSGTPNRSNSRMSASGGRFSRMRISPKDVPISPNTYTYNPRDQLDSEIGRIVNNCPLRVKISKANDPNKYWIGESLCYCRILASKMVMVRVGGGWCELSRYLLDHNTELNSDIIELGGEKINLNLNLKTPKQKRAVSWSVNTPPSATTTPVPGAGRQTPSRQTSSRQGTRQVTGRLTPGQQVSPNSLHKLTLGRKVEGSKSPSPRKTLSLNRTP
ncbi:hypothetical protein K7432_001616 [Basidiobolus ranarum]|uniref:GAR domain-containing protein n=1 Tax=Basidiobolus ranarum TaxID=34480 RepID=A0ABR2W972_9FUNG